MSWVPYEWRAVGLIASAVFALHSNQLYAQTPDGDLERCVVLGPLAVSSYVAFLDKVAAGERRSAADWAASAVDVIQLYATLGCNTDTLNNSLECLSARLTAPEDQVLTSGQVQDCMREAGMPTR